MFSNKDNSGTILNVRAAILVSIYNPMGLNAIHRTKNDMAAYTYYHKPLHHRKHLNLNKMIKESAVMILNISGTSVNNKKSLLIDLLMQL